MTKFEQVGVEFQYDARNKKEANRSFQYSCRVCCERGMHIECDRCAIAATNAILVAAFDTERCVEETDLVVGEGLTQRVG